MKTLSLKLPDEVDDKEIKMTLAALLFEKGILSSGQAATVAEITKREFIETVGRYGVSIFHETNADLKKTLLD